MNARVSCLATLLVVTSTASAAPPSAGPPGPIQGTVHDELTGTWVPVNSANQPVPPTVSIAFKSKDPATGKKTYHVLFSLKSASPQLQALTDLQAFDMDGVATVDSYLTVEKLLPPWTLGGGVTETPKVQAYVRPSTNPDKKGQLEVGVDLFAFGNSWSLSPSAVWYQRKPSLQPR